MLRKLVKILFVPLLVTMIWSVPPVDQASAQATPRIQVRVLEPGSGWVQLSGLGDRHILSPAYTTNFSASSGVIENVGDAPLTVNSVTLSPLFPFGHSAMRLSVLSSLPRTLAPGEKIRFTIFLESTVADTYRSTLSISHNDPFGPEPFTSKPEGTVSPNEVPRAWADVPGHNQVMSGTFTAKGWATDDQGVSFISFQVRDPSGIIVWHQFGFNYGTHRQDVCNVHSDLDDPNCPWVGWEGQIDTTTFENGTYVLHVDARDSLATQTVFKRTFQINN